MQGQGKISNEYRVIGPPGTGKTTFLTEKIKNVVRKRGPESLLVASFTRTAAKELAGRNDQVIGEHQIGTLHSHCFHALGCPTIAESKIKDFNEHYPNSALSDQTVNTSEGKVDQNFNSKNDEFFADYQIYRNRMVPREAWPDGVKGIANSWEDFKMQTGHLDFTDLIETALYTLLYPPHNTTIGIFDEVQDFTPLQMKLLRSWASQMDYIMLTGDCDQLLYDFAGCSPESFQYPELPEEQKHVLSQSYRVPRAAHSLAQRIIRNIPGREDVKYYPTSQEGNVQRIMANYKMPHSFLPIIEQELKEDRNVMILAACGYMLNGIIQKLRDEGIPFHNPYRLADRSWNPLGNTSGVSTKDRMLAYLNPQGPQIGNSRLWTLEQLQSWIELINTKGILNHGSKKQIKEKAQEDIDINEFAQFYKEVFKLDKLVEAAKLDMSWLLDNATAQKKKALMFPLNIIQRDSEALNKKPKVKIGSIHSVKGGEEQTVLLLPDLSMQAQKQYMLGRGQGRDSIYRQFYVGITRTWDRLYIASPASPKLCFKEILK